MQKTTYVSATHNSQSYLELVLYCFFSALSIFEKKKVAF